MKQLVKTMAYGIPWIGPTVRSVVAKTRLAYGKWKHPFQGTADYWEKRYQAGGNSGAGSYGQLAEFKADVINRFVEQQQIKSVVEFGCGDGNQLSLLKMPNYTGIDLSAAAVAGCRRRFASDPSKRFVVSGLLDDIHAELSLSLDVIFHLVEDEIYDQYMRNLFNAATRYVMVYASNYDELLPGTHMRHHCFTDWVERHAPQWSLMDTIKNEFPVDPAKPDTTSYSDFYVFAKVESKVAGPKVESDSSG